MGMLGRQAKAGKSRKQTSPQQSPDAAVGKKRRKKAVRWFSKKVGNEPPARAEGVI